MKVFLKRTSSVFLMAIIIMISSCSTETRDAETTEVGDVKITYADQQGADAEKYVAVLAIEGMACEMMCVNKIQTTLKGLDGVRNVDIAFESAEVDNMATVEFDKSAISEKEMIQAISELAGGHYKVKSVKVTHYAASLNEGQSEPLEVGAINPKINYEIPNIFSVFAKLF